MLKDVIMGLEMVSLLFDRIQETPLILYVGYLDIILRQKLFWIMIQKLGLE